MQFKKVLGSLLTLWLVCGSFAIIEAKTQRRSAKTTASSFSKKQAATKKSTVASRRSSSKGKSTRARRSASPRQAQPTPDRFKEIQQALADKGYYTGEIDGVWNASCIASLKRFQAEQNLEPDGKLGALSLIALGLGPKREPLPPRFTAKPEPGH